MKKPAIFLSILFLLIVARAAAAAAAPESAAAEQKRVLALLAGAENMTLSQDAYDATGLELQTGHLKITWASGACRDVFWGSEKKGIFIAGQGKARYTSEDELDEAVLKHNVDRLFLLKSTKQDESGRFVTFKVEKCLILGNESLFRQVREKNLRRATVNGDGRNELNDLLKHTRNLVNYSAPMYIAYMDSNRLPEPYTVTLFKGGSTILHVYDPVLLKEENLYLLLKRHYERRVYYVRRLMSNQKAGVERGMNVPYPITLTSVDHDLNYEKGQTFSLTSKLGFVTALPDRRTLLLNLWNSNNPKNLLWNTKKHRLILKKLTDENGNDVPFIHRYNKLLVFLDAPKPKSAEIRLNAEMEENILTMNWHSGDQRFLLLDQPWFPRPPSSAEFCAWRVKVRSRKPYWPVLPGTEIASGTDGNFYVAEAFENGNVPSPPIICGKYYENITDEDGLRIETFTYGYNYRQQFFEEEHEDARKALNRFSRELSPYPFRALKIVETGTLGRGHVYPGMLLDPESGSPGMAFFSSNFWDDFYQFNDEGGFFGQAHWSLRHGAFFGGIARQWFGILVRPPSREELWMYEALCQYCAFRFLRDEEYDRAKYMYKAWKLGCEWSEGKGSIYMGNYMRSKTYDSNRERIRYLRAPMMIHAIANEIGDENLVRAMSLLVTEHAGGLAGSTDFLAALNEVSGRDLSEFFHTWLYGLRTPSIPPFEPAEKTSAK